MWSQPQPQRHGNGGVWLAAVVALVLASHFAPSRATNPADTGPPAGLTFTNAHGCRPAGDYASAKLDRRVRRLLMAAAHRAPIRVSCIHAGHSRYVKGTHRVSNHTVWRGVDIDRVGGRPVSRANTTARALARWIGEGKAGATPSEVGSPWGFEELAARPWFTDAGHDDHLHVGFAGPTQASGR
jgi:hypothetical protein